MFWMILGLQLIGTLIGCLIGAYITGRWTETGRINAVKAASAKVVEQETAKAFAQEQGKNLARKEDLNEILAELRAMTITQKEIEAKISNEALDRQWILNQKRDLYTKSVDVGQRLVQIYINIGAIAPCGEINLDDLKKQGEEHDKVLEASLELHRLAPFAEIFGSEECRDAVIEYCSEVPTSKFPTKQWAEEGEESLKALVTKLITAARREFGLES